MPEKSKKRQKVETLEKLVEKGVNPFDAHRFERTHKCREIGERFEELQGEVIRSCGRIKSLRPHGKVAFIDLKDSSGDIQLFMEYDTLGEEQFEILEHLGRGDYIGVEGHTFKTERGEKSLKVEEFEVLSKCLRNLPPERSGLEDKEKRYRQRYLDLKVEDEVREVFVKRHKITSAMREFLNQNGFIEIETPILQEVYGGALARPFKTQHNELDREFYLRIASELYLKRLIVGGYEKVYEIAKYFRNESIDTTHNPEFTTMEFYEAYTDYRDVMERAENMVAYIAEQVNGGTKIEFKGQKIDLSPPWNRLSITEALEKHADIENAGKKSREELIEEAEDHGLEVAENASWGEILTALFEELCEEEIVQPTFVHDYPVEVSPLAKQKESDKRFTERFEIFIAGEEFGNAYSELNNPIEQKKRFEEQVKMRKEGDMEAHDMDEDYIRALEYGMPPTGGFGIGIDRLTMLLTDKGSIKEVIAFPQLAERESAIKLHSDIVKDKVFE